jgi:hypothetical protein
MADEVSCMHNLYASVETKKSQLVVIMKYATN